jgi:hypothetical protein
VPSPHIEQLASGSKEQKEEPAVQTEHWNVGDANLFVLLSMTIIIINHTHKQTIVGGFRLVCLFVFNNIEY